MTPDFVLSGVRLAAACVDDLLFPIRIYEVASGNLKYDLYVLTIRAWCILFLTLKTHRAATM